MAKPLEAADIATAEMKTFRKADITGNIEIMRFMSVVIWCIAREFDVRIAVPISNLPTTSRNTRNRYCGSELETISPRSLFLPSLDEKYGKDLGLLYKAQWFWQRHNTHAHGIWWRQKRRSRRPRAKACDVTLPMRASSISRRPAIGTFRPNQKISVMMSNRYSETFGGSSISGVPGPEM